MARIHLTGASGYLGDALRRRLEADGHRVEPADYRLPEGPVRRVEADLLIHLAAAGGGSHHLRRPGGEDPGLARAVNVDGFANLLDRLDGRVPRVLFFSSNAVYGDVPPPHVADETRPPAPTGAYGADKLAAERLVRASGLDFVILRPCGVFGPSPGGNYGGSFLNVAIDTALREGRLPLLGGDQGIDSLFLDDLVTVVARLCADEWRAGETYNVAGDIVAVRDLMTVLAAVLARVGRPCRLDPGPWSGGPAVLLDTRRLRRDLPGWRPTPLAVSLERLVRARLA